MERAKARHAFLTRCCPSGVNAARTQYTLTKEEAAFAGRIGKERCVERGQRGRGGKSSPGAWWEGDAAAVRCLTEQQQVGALRSLASRGA
jgi:hypothetical protein